MVDKTRYVEIIESIIKEQEQVMGPMARSLAISTGVISMDNSHVLSINGDFTTALKSLVDQYAGLFGRTSVEVCRSVLYRLKIPSEDDSLPDILRQHH